MVPKLVRKFQLMDTFLQDNHSEYADIVVPLALTDYDILNANPAFLGKALWPSASAVTTCNDKKIFREWFQSHFDHNYLPAQTYLLRLVIVKPRQGEWGRGTFLVETSSRDTLEAARTDPTLCMEDYVVGHREFSLHVLFDQGRLLYSAQSTYDHDLDCYLSE